MTNRIPTRITLTEGSLATFEAPQGTDTKRRFNMVAYTGAAMEAGMLGKVVIDLNGLNANGERKPILRQHDHDRIAGYSDTIVKGNKLTMAGTLSAKTDAGREVADLADEGFPWQASVGIDIQKMERVKAGDTVTVNGAEFAGPGIVISQSLLKESSFVPLGADGATSGIVFADSAALIDLPSPIQEKPMTSAEFAAANADAVKDWKNEGFVEGAKTASEELTGRFAALAEKFADRPQFVIDQFKKGHDIGKASVELADVQAAELKALREQNAELQAKATAGTGFSGVSTPMGAAPTPEAAAKPDGTDHKALAAWEWENEPQHKAKFSSKDRYIGFRVAVLSGMLRLNNPR
jgi:hypothetical protein